MSANQEIIESFPQDGGYWLIKWIDEFRLAHARTRSTSVVVMLQLLPHRSGAEVAKIKPADCAALLGKKSGGEWPKFAFAKVLVGALPLLTVGAVFKDRVKVGELPWLLRRISFLPGDLDDNEVEAGQLVDPPPDWPKEYPCKMLNPSEYVGLIDHKKNSVEPVSFTNRALQLPFGAMGVIKKFTSSPVQQFSKLSTHPIQKLPKPSAALHGPHRSRQ